MSKIDWNDFLVHNGYDYDPSTDLYTNLITGKRMACLTAVREKMGGSIIGTITGGWLGGEEAYNQAPSHTHTNAQSMTAGLLGQQQAVQVGPGVFASGNYPMTGGTTFASTGTHNVGVGWQPAVNPLFFPPKIVGQSHMVCIGVDITTLWWDGKRWTTEWDDVEPLIAKQAIKGDSGITADELEEAQKIIEELSSGKEAQI